jgi:DNA repair protein RadC
MKDTVSIQQLPPDMRPREKILALGPASLTDTELLALLLRTGVAGKPVFDLARDLLRGFRGFAGLIHANAQELKSYKGMGGTAKRAQLLAVLEISRRALIQEMRENEVMHSPAVVKQYLQLELAQLKHEVFAVLFLDAQNRLLSYQPMFRGSLSQAMVYPREVAKTALTLGANGVVLAHNHPSGSIRPSKEDMELTKTMQEALGVIDVTVRDHIIVAQGKYLSMAEEGLI